MEVTFYHFPKRVNSTKRPSGGGNTVTAVMKDICDLHAPTIAVKDVADDYNYFTIGNDCFYVTARRVMPSNWVEYSGQLDAMGTYAEQIKATRAFIERCNIGTTALVDSLAPSQTDEVYSHYTAAIPYFESIPTNGTYFVRIANMPEILALNHVELSNLYDAVSGQDVWDAIKEYFIDMSSLILSINFVPINQSRLATGRGYLKVAFFDTGFSGPVISPQILTGEATFTIAETSGNISTGSSAYVRITLFLPFAGCLTISPDDLRGRTLHIRYSIDVLSGAIEYSIMSGNDEIGHAGGNCMLSVPFGTSGVNVGSLASSAVSIAGAVAGAAVTGNPLALVGGLVSAAGSGSLASATGGGSIGGNLAGLSFLNIGVTVIRRTPPEPLAAKADVIGLPTFRTMTIGSLNGFVKCLGASVECEGNAQELAEINGYLNSGAWIE